MSRFIVPGLISYRDRKGGVDLVRKETIDLCLNSMLGAVLTIKHPAKDVILSRNWTDVSHGKVDKVEWDPVSGFYVAEGTVETDAARERINAGDGISCGFSVLERTGPGTWGQIPYTQEDTRIEFHHLALVEKPRIEEADIRLNAKQNAMNLIKWITKKVVGDKPTEEAKELPASTKISLGDGQSATLEEMLTHERLNAVHEVTPEDFVEHEGMRYNAMDLIRHYREHCNSTRVRMNSVTGKPETPEEKATREQQERTNAAAPQTTPPASKEVELKADNALGLPAGKYRVTGDKMERVNAVEETPEQRTVREKQDAETAIQTRIKEARAEERATIERENAAARGAASFRILSGASSAPVAQTPPEYSLGMSGSLEDGVNLGRERYGKPPTNRLAGAN